MKIRIIQTVQGSEDGVTTKSYEKNSIYDVGDKLGKALVDAKYAEAYEEKSEYRAPENKMADDPFNKGDYQGRGRRRTQ
jgi:hypothetical protein